jgi:hypothetical protein
MKLADSGTVSFQQVSKAERQELRKVLRES